MTNEANLVINLADHFKKLKREALYLKKELNASKRGYFTPSEEEQVRHLWVSYWQSREALLELIFSIKEKNFLIAYAAAILLVDVAKFIYENFDNIPIIRRKLNEPYKHFRIPKNSYDNVYKSLAKPENQWRLLQANNYYKQYKKEGYKKKMNPVLTKVKKIVDELEGRLKINPNEYAKLLIQVGVREIEDSIKEVTIEQVAYGIQESVSKRVSGISTKPSHKPSLPDKVREQLLSEIKPGDILITRKEYALTNYFLPGYWPHASLYLGKKNGKHKVLEALKDGVHIRAIESPFDSDAIIVIRPKLDEKNIEKSIKRGLKHNGKPYDFDFDFTQSEKMVCTEVIYRSYEGVGSIKFELNRRAGRWTLSAEDLLKMSLEGSFLETIIGFYPKYGEKLIKGVKLEKILEKNLKKIENSN